jgi:hypothetical protein
VSVTASKNDGFSAFFKKFRAIFDKFLMKFAYLATSVPERTAEMTRFDRF